MVGVQRISTSASHGLDQLFPGHRQGVNEGLHRRLAVAPASLMGSHGVVLADPLIEVGLQLRDRVIELLAQRHLVELRGIM